MINQINNNEGAKSIRDKLNAVIAIVTQITGIGSGSIITSAERTKIDNITDVGSGEIITDLERTKLSTIEQDAEVNDQDAVFFGTLTSSGTSITLDSRYISYAEAFNAVRIGAGQYTITSSSGLFGNGTFVSLSPSQECFYTIEVASASMININTFDAAGTQGDDILTNALLKIENYPV